VDICPWKCIHYLSIEAIAEATNTADPRTQEGYFGMFVVDEDECTRCALCVDRCPTGVISLGKFDGSLADRAVVPGAEAPWEVDSGQRDHKNGYAYGMRF
jgi:NAD-dependent dihydropyrimidine dehydrogenase PreA subunit